MTVTRCCAIAAMSLISQLLSKIFPKSEFRALMVSLDAAGKTTILYKFKLGEVITTIPTVGFNVETFDYNGVNFTIWDVGGCDRIRPLWRHYFKNTHAIIFVVDSCDRDRFAEVRDEFHRLLSEKELEASVLLVFANKQDLPSAMSQSEIEQKLGIDKLGPTSAGGIWNVRLQPCCAIDGSGLYEGLGWLADALKGSRGASKDLGGGGRRGRTRRGGRR